MLTPVDIQDIRFKTGFGYDKKEVNSFVKEVSSNYEELYRSNAVLKQNVATLKDDLQRYKATEDSLQKALMLAKKTSEESKSSATREAKAIELEAKHKANEIIKDAYESLEQMKNQMEALKEEYANYKNDFTLLIKDQYRVLKKLDFDPDSIVKGETRNKKSNKSTEFTAYNGDPQGREESNLAGFNSQLGASLPGNDNTSSSAMYAQTLNNNDNFVDPFSPKEDVEGRYNPYDGREPKTVKATKNGPPAFKLNEKKVPTSGKIVNKFQEDYNKEEYNKPSEFNKDNLYETDYNYNDSDEEAKDTTNNEATVTDN